MFASNRSHYLTRYGNQQSIITCIPVYQLEVDNGKLTTISTLSAKDEKTLETLIPLLIKELLQPHVG